MTFIPLFNYEKSKILLQLIIILKDQHFNSNQHIQLDFKVFVKNDLKLLSYKNKILNYWLMECILCMYLCYTMFLRKYEMLFNY